VVLDDVDAYYGLMYLLLVALATAALRLVASMAGA
jgi:hypothetical protein